MARQSNLHYVGTVGNIIFYMRQGEYYMRTKPAVVRRSPASKISAGKFGQASKLGTPLRKALVPLSAAGDCRPLMYRLNNALQTWLQNRAAVGAGIRTIPEFMHFQLNPATTFSERFRPVIAVSPSGTGMLTASIPAFTCKTGIVAPAGTSTVHIHLIALSVNMESNSIMEVEQSNIDLPYNNNVVASASYSFTTAAGPGNMRVLAAGLRYRKRKVGG